MIAPATEESKLNRALELLGGSIDPEIANSYSSWEERILAQALENVELAERRLREIQKLVDDLSEVSAWICLWIASTGETNNMSGGILCLSPGLYIDSGSSCILCLLYPTNLCGWSFNLLNSPQYEEEAEYTSQKNSAGNQEVYAKAGTISYDPCDYRSYDPCQITQEVHNTPNSTDSSFRGN